MLESISTYDGAGKTLSVRTDLEELEDFNDELSPMMFKTMSVEEEQQVVVKRAAQVNTYQTNTHMHAHIHARTHARTHACPTHARTHNTHIIILLELEPSLPF